MASYLSDTESDIDSSLEHINVNKLTNNEFGASPYQFEPISNDKEREESTNEPTEEENSVQRINQDNTSTWCKCNRCVKMTKEEECKCCTEVPEYQALMAEFTEFSCLTEHPGFNTVCLDLYVLRTAYYNYRQYQHRQAPESNSRHRYIAYRQLARWGFGWLGRNNRIPLPSCAVDKIRKAFPSESDDYVGFLKA